MQDCTDTLHVIVMKQTVEFQNIDRDFQFIFRSFSLLSWVTHDCQVSISHVSEQNGMKKYLFSHKPILIGRLNGCLYEFNKNQKTFTIQYYLQGENQVLTQAHKIVASFQKVQISGQYSITVKISDPTKILRNTFIPPMTEKLQHRRNALKNNQIIYYYIEPNNIRNQECTTPHFSIAFQGGGAKGIAYIGAYKAIKETYPDRKIKSVIGSSAGGMLALAMCTGVELDEIVKIVSQMGKIPKDKLIRNKDDLTPQKQQYYKTIVNHIRNFLHDYGLMHNKIFDIIKNDILTQEIIEEIFGYLFEDNESLKEMFSLSIPDPNEEGGFKPQLTNYYGLLEAKLMRGNQILQISIRMIEGFLRGLEKHKPDLLFQTFKMKHKKLQNKEFRELSERLTMREFYIMTDHIEFTCTAVDIDNNVLRFFNHKTTPDLPVVKAVQMTGSFPVAFQALKWKRQWGKYFIHYQRHRKEIDLTNHQFTDGGMLANFPIKYLDNQEMRPMYFAHKKNNMTTLFGFGLREMEEDETQTEQAIQAKLKAKMQKYEKLMKKIKSNVSYSKMVIALAQVPLTTQEVDPKNLSKIRNIPIVDFLLKLLQTYQNSNDNLVRQCFEYQTFLFTEKTSKIQAIDSEKVSSLIPKYQKLLVLVQQLKQSVQKSQYSVKTAMQHFKNLKNVLIKGPITSTTLHTIKQSIKKAAINFNKYIKQVLIMTHLDNIIEQKQYLQQIKSLQKQYDSILTQLQTVGVIQVFSKSNKFSSDAKILIGMIDRIDNTYHHKQRKQNISKMLQTDLQHFFIYRKNKQLMRIKKIQKIQKDYLRQLQDSNDQNMPDMDPKLIKLIIEFKRKIQNPEMLAYKIFNKKLQELKFKTLEEGKYIQNIRESIQYYTNWMFVNSPPEESDLHLVFQGIGISLTFYHKSYTIIQDMIFQTQSKKTRELSYQITNDILKNAQKEISSNFQKYSKQNDLKYALLKYVECNLHELEKLQTFDINEEVRFIPDKALKKSIIKSIKKNKMKKINSITCSNYHSILGFFIAIGFKEDRIQKEILKIKYYTGVKSNIEKQFKSKKWTLPQRCTIRDIQDKIWNNRYNLFESLEKVCSVQNDKDLSKNLERIRLEFQKSKDIILDGFEHIIDYLINVQIYSKKQKNPNDYIAKYLSLKLPNKNYTTQNKKLSQGTQSLIYHLLDFFKEEIKFMIMNIYEQETISDMILTENDPQKLEVMWKGLIIGSFYQADQLKQKIQDTLEEVNFPKNMTLRQFYEACPRKIKLNFMAVDMRSQRIYFINHYTFPYMTVWAAILITSSFPGFFPQIRCQPQWIQKISVSSKERTIRTFFAQKVPKHLPSFVSGNLLASFPLQLLTNREVRSRYLDVEGRQTFLNFGILKAKRQSSLRKYKRSYVSLDDILAFGLKLFTKYLFGYQIVPSFNIAAIDQKIKILTTFINSNDNLIQDLYQNNTLMLPIKLGTLDFHKINKPLLLQMAIEQSCYITIQKLSIQKGTYFRLDIDDDVYNLKFFSRGQNQITSLYNKTNLSYKFSQEDDFVLLVDQNIELDPYLDEIWIQFYYVSEKKNIKQNVYRIKYSQIVSKYVQFSGIYYLPYDSILNTELKPEQEPIFNLKDCRYKQNPNLPIISVIDFQKQGLYCTSCCHDLNHFSQKQFQRCYNKKLINGHCSNCDEIQPIRFTCICSKKYCARCTRDKIVIRKKSSLRCLRGHIFDFFSKHQVNFRLKIYKFTLCNFCTQYTEAYYQDVQCGIQICQFCCAQLIQK